MWKIFSRLFGWHYVAYRYGDTDSIGRIVIAPNGVLMVSYCCTYTLQVAKKTGRKFIALTMTQENLDELLKG